MESLELRTGLDRIGECDSWSFRLDSAGEDFYVTVAG